MSRRCNGDNLHWGGDRESMRGERAGIMRSRAKGDKVERGSVHEILATAARGRGRAYMI